MDFGSTMERFASMEIIFFNAVWWVSSHDRVLNCSRQTNFKKFEEEGPAVDYEAAGTWLCCLSISRLIIYVNIKTVVLSDFLIRKCDDLHHRKRHGPQAEKYADSTEVQVHLRKMMRGLPKLTLRGENGKRQIEHQKMRRCTLGINICIS